MYYVGDMWIWNVYKCAQGGEGIERGSASSDQGAYEMASFVINTPICYHIELINTLGKCLICEVNTYVNETYCCR